MRIFFSCILIACMFSAGCGEETEKPGIPQINVKQGEDGDHSETKGKKMTDYETDTIETSKGPLEITFIGHATLVMKFDGKTIHVDPFGKAADYSMLPDADIILSTHHHFDHLDPDAVKEITTDSTKMIYTELCGRNIPGGTVMKNGDTLEVEGIKIEAVPAYNIKHKRESGDPFHPKGEGNGYVLTFGETRIYIAGDTENIPEMKELKDIDIAFLPMNLPYTMTPQMVAEAVNVFNPKIVYPYHYGETDTQELINLLKNHPGLEIRIRQLQ